jgi:uncharacterized membrane protein
MTGYVRTIDFEAMVAAGSEADVLIGLIFRPGDFVIGGGGVIGIYPEERAPDACRSPRPHAGRHRHRHHRTPVQDPDFSIRHLVEIAVRALSPIAPQGHSATQMPQPLQ